jgi:hypothetical protein
MWAYLRASNEAPNMNSTKNVIGGPMQLLEHLQPLKTLRPKSGAI